MSEIKNGDFVEILYTGKANDAVFDSNIEEDLKKIDDKAKPQKTILIVGQRMIVKGLDEALVGKEIGKEYSLSLSVDDAFGPRRKELVKTIPLHVFTERKISPRQGATFLLDNMLVRIIAVSGARVTADFNNPLSGKKISYKFKIKRIVDDIREKSEAFFIFFFRMIPEFDISDKIIVKGPKPFEFLVSALKDKFKELLGRDLDFKLENKAEKEHKEPKEAE